MKHPLIYNVRVPETGKNLFNNKPLYLGQLAHLLSISASINWPCC